MKNKKIKFSSEQFIEALNKKSRYFKTQDFIATVKLSENSLGLSKLVPGYYKKKNLYDLVKYIADPATDEHAKRHKPSYRKKLCNIIDYVENTPDSILIKYYKPEVKEYQAAYFKDNTSKYLKKRRFQTDDGKERFLDSIYLIVEKVPGGH